MKCAATLLPSTSEPWASAEIFPEEQNILPFSKGAKTLKSTENCPKVIQMFEKDPKNHKDPNHSTYVDHPQIIMYFNKVKKRTISIRIF